MQILHTSASNVTRLTRYVCNMIQTPKKRYQLSNHQKTQAHQQCMHAHSHCRQQTTSNVEKKHCYEDRLLTFVEWRNVPKLSQLPWKTNVRHGQHLGPHKHHQYQVTRRQQSGKGDIQIPPKVRSLHLLVVDHGQGW